LRLSRPRALYLPVLGLLAATLVLLTVVTVTTYVNLERGRDQARRILAAQSSAIVSGLAAGLRTGWRHMVLQEGALQELVQDMARVGDVAFIALLDKNGEVVAHSDPKQVGRRLTKSDLNPQDVHHDKVHSWFKQPDLFLAGRRLRPEEYKMGPGMGPGQGPGQSQGEGKGHGMRGRMMMSERVQEMQDKLPVVILVGMKTDTYREAWKRQLQHGLVMAVLLFVLGSGAIYFIFVIQNYRTIERTLSDLNTYTSEIVNHMPNGLITVDDKEHPVMVNRAARNMFGWGSQSERALADEPVIKELCREFGPRLDRGETILEQEFETETERDFLPLAVSGATVPAVEGEEGRSGKVFILRDLRQIRALEAEVQQSEKLAAVGRLAAGIAHEVRNPLSSMRGLARFLGRNLEDNSREAEYLKVMIEEIDRLNRVITGLLDFAKPRQADLKPVDLNATARHTSDLVNDDVRHTGISLREDMDPRNPFILADRDQAIQAMLNLLLNAVEAMPEGGRMTVSTKQENGYGMFMVEDTGPGIPMKDRSRLCDPFFTTKKKGTGLGLAQVAGIMEANGGRLELGGEPGQGARAVLYFPLAEPSETEADK
jgi:two-component system sensor histidine kinase HydH